MKKLLFITIMMLLAAAGYAQNYSNLTGTYRADIRTGSQNAHMTMTITRANNQSSSALAIFPTSFNGFVFTSPWSNVSPNEIITVKITPMSRRIRRASGYYAGLSDIRYTDYYWEAKAPASTIEGMLRSKIQFISIELW